MLKRRDFEKYSLALDDYGIMWLKVKPYTVLELSDVEKYEEDILDFIEYKPTPFIIDTRVEMFSSTKDAQDFIAKKSRVVDYRLCESVIVNNFGLRLIVEFYIKFIRRSPRVKNFKFMF